MVSGKQVSHLLIELSEVILDHAQLFECEFQQPTVDRMQGRTRVEGIAQLLRRGAQAWSRERCEGGGIALTSATACNMRRALMPSRSETMLDTLMCASSRSASKRLCSCTRFRVT